MNRPQRPTCRSAAAALVLGSAALLAGCGPPDRLAVLTGRVSYAGQPLPGAKVHIKAMSPDAQVQTTYAVLRPDGTFRVSEVPVGPVAVAVDTEYVRRELIPAMRGTPDAAAFRYVELPKKYSNFDTSGLTLEIKPGTNEANLDLVP